jgi:TPR repeat protein
MTLARMDIKRALFSRVKTLPRFLAAAFAVMSLMGAAEGQQQAPTEASAVAAEVLARSDWQTAANQCPSKVMQAREMTDYQERDSCKAGRLEACLTKCSAGEAGACYWLGHELQLAAAEPQAAELLYQQACRLGAASGCTNKAAGLMRDKHTDPSIQACAAETFSKACALDDPWACTMYAFHLSRGMGTKRDKKLALQVLSKSCRYGPEDAACSRGMALKKRLLEDAVPSKANR